MLISFKVSNFLSFDREQKISMIPSLKVENKEHLITSNNIELLKMGVIFGANSSGKSNFVKAMALGKEIILDSLSPKHKNYFSRTALENQKKDTIFEYTFFIDDHYYSYGFSFILFDGIITGEWLYEIDPLNDEEKLIFERSPIDKTFNYNLDLNENENTRINTYISDFLANKEMLFITEMNRNKRLESNFKVFKRVYQWFKNSLNINFQNQDITFLNYVFDKTNEEFFDIFKIFDTGISDVILINTTYEELKEKLSKKTFEILAEKIANRSSLENGSFAVKLANALFNIRCGRNIPLEITSTSLKHENTEFTFDFDEESDGTKRLFELIDILIRPKENSIYIFDEINRSFHPILTRKYVQLFNKFTKNKNVQILFTSHEATLLSKNLLRRDEVWFVEKTKENTSKLFSLDIFKAQNNKQLSEAYLQGSYGGVPLINENGDE